jgi:hypothetical protein
MHSQGTMRAEARRGSRGAGSTNLRPARDAWQIADMWTSGIGRPLGGSEMPLNGLMVVARAALVLD